MQTLYLFSVVDLEGCFGKPKVIDGLRPLTGEVTSPGYKEGEDYPTDLKCQFTIKAPYGFVSSVLYHCIIF